MFTVVLYVLTVSVCREFSIVNSSIIGTKLQGVEIDLTLTWEKNHKTPTHTFVLCVKLTKKYHLVFKQNFFGQREFFCWHSCIFFEDKSSAKEFYELALQTFTLSFRYRKQMEEMQKAFNKTIIKLQNTSRIAEEQVCFVGVLKCFPN